MNDDDINRILREAGQRYVVDAQRRPLGYLLTPEEYADYLDMLEKRRSSRSPDLKQPPVHGVACVGTPGQQLLAFAGIIPTADAEMMRQAVEAACETVDPHGW